MPSAHLSSATRRRVSKEVPTSPAFRKVRSSSARDEVPRDESPSSTIVALSLSRAGASSCEYIPLTAAAPWVHNGWCFDSSKSRGHLVLHIGNAHRRPGTQLETFASNLVSNEFWNLVSELCPTLYFCCQTAAVAAAVPGPMTTLRQAVIGTIVSTALQHFCSLVSHACSRQSARMSHAIWYIDYAGILLNFVWNAAPLVYSIEPALERTWPLWLAYNLIATVVLLGGSIHLVCTHRIEPAPGSESGNGQAAKVVQNAANVAEEARNLGSTGRQGLFRDLLLVTRRHLPPRWHAAAGHLRHDRRGALRAARAPRQLLERRPRLARPLRRPADQARAPPRSVDWQDVRPVLLSAAQPLPVALPRVAVPALLPLVL